MCAQCRRPRRTAHWVNFNFVNLKFEIDQAPASKWIRQHRIWTVVEFTVTLPTRLRSWGRFAMENWRLLTFQMEKTCCRRFVILIYKTKYLKISVTLWLIKLPHPIGSVVFQHWICARQLPANAHGYAHFVGATAQPSVRSTVCKFV